MAQSQAYWVAVRNPEIRKDQIKIIKQDTNLLHHRPGKDLLLDGTDLLDDVTEAAQGAECGSLLLDLGLEALAVLIRRGLDAG